MKVVVLGLLLSVSFGVMAQVVPMGPAGLPKVGVHQTNRSNMKIMRKEKVYADENKMNEEMVKRVRHYDDIFTNENFQAVANTARLMQNSPEKLLGDKFMEAYVAEQGPIDREVDVYEPGAIGDDAVANFENFQMPQLSDAIEHSTGGSEIAHKEYPKVRKQIEQIGRQHLGQKAVPVLLQ